MKVIPQKGAGAPTGFKVDGVSSGVKSGGKMDLAVVVSEKPAAAAAVFTTNKVVAAPVIVSRNRPPGPVKAVIINSGNANACTGETGLVDARTMIDLTAARLSIPASEVLVASTGVIGRFLPMDKIAAGINSLQPAAGEEADADFARAVMTTDAYPKYLAVEIKLSGGRVTVGGTAKGAGMIAPDLAPHATMIAVITTDAPVAEDDLTAALTASTAQSFNAVTVDGDTSTNDCVFLLANGMAGDWELTSDDKRLFQEALDYVSLQLAKMIVRDGEGATKIIEYKVVGAATEEAAAKAAKTAAGSILVKTAFFGRDPNWGRILAALGRSGVELDPNDVDIDINSVPVVRFGRPALSNSEELAGKMEAEEIQVWINLNQGSSQSSAWGCDLSYDFVKLNAEYIT